MKTEASKITIVANNNTSLFIAEPVYEKDESVKEFSLFPIVAWAVEVSSREWITSVPVGCDGQNGMDFCGYVVYNISDKSWYSCDTHGNGVADLLRHFNGWVK